MIITINEKVSVDFLSNHLTGKVYPWVISWRGRQYRITTVGLHHMVREGRILFHVFSVTDGTTYFKLVFDTDHLTWQLVEVGTE
jgi:hypothetical protein